MAYIQNVAVSVLQGSGMTLKLFIITLVLSIPMGLLISLMRISKLKLLHTITEIYIWLMRGTPLMLQIFFIYFGLPSLGIRFERFPAAVIAFSLNYAAYFAEIFRAGIQSIDRGQYEASYALGLTYKQTMRRIVLPQVVKRVLPPVSNEVITLIKDTALIYVIGLGELLRAAKIAATRDFTISPYVIAGVVYLLLTLVLTWVFKALEKKYAYYE